MKVSTAEASLRVTFTLSSGIRATGAGSAGSVTSTTCRSSSDATTA